MEQFQCLFEELLGKEMRFVYESAWYRVVL